EAERKLRHQLESFHGKKDPAAVEAAWLHLAHPDRFIRFAARVAIEHQDANLWRERALAEKDPARAIAALLALARVSAADPFHRTDKTPAPDDSLRRQTFAALLRLDWGVLSDEQRLDLLRVWHVALNRMGPPDDELKQALVARFDKVYPAPVREQNAE